MQSFFKFLYISLFLSFTSAQDSTLPTCTDLGIYLCVAPSGALCDNYCRTQGSQQKDCRIYDESLRIDCQCEEPATGCYDEVFNETAIPTCQEFQMFGCTYACNELCASLPNTLGLNGLDDGMGRKATCNELDGLSKCMCDGLAVCDDRVNLTPTSAPGIASSTNAVFGMLGLSIASVMTTFIWS